MSAVGTVDLDKTITTTEVVRLFGTTRRTIQRRMESGELRPVKKLSGKTGAFLFKLEDIERVFGHH